MKINLSKVAETRIFIHKIQARIKKIDTIIYRIIIIVI
jgi:hypothetical protein